MKSKQKTRLLVTVISFFICSTLLLSCSSDKEEVSELIRPVRYEKVKSAGSKSARTFSGVAKSGIAINLSFRIGGILKNVNVKSGQKVEKGSLIAALDDSDEKLKYDEAYAAMKNSQVQMETADSNLERVRQLYENNNVSLSEYEAAKNEFSAAQANFKSSVNRLDLQKSQVSYSRLYAPMDGIIGEVPVEKNENVTPGQLIAGLDSGGDIEVSVGIPDPFITSVKTGDTVTVKFSSIPDHMFIGTVSEVSYVSSGASTYPVKVRLENPGETIRPGMPAEVVFQFDTQSKEKNIVVPAGSVAEDTSGNFVFIVVEGDEKGFALVHKKEVSVGKLMDNGFEIESGLEEGDLVVTSGISKVTDGMKVRFLSK